MENFEIIWDRIIEHQGEQFLTITGLPFTYTIKKGNIFRSNRAEYNIHKSNFIQAYEIWPVSGPGQIGKAVMGPSLCLGCFK